MKDSITTLCQRNESAIKAAFGKVGQNRIADLTGVSDTLISRWKDNDASRCAAIMAAAGLIVVPADTPAVDAEELRALRAIVHKATAPDSGWGGL